MRCPKCGKDVELQNKQVGADENGEPIFNEYAICKDCKKQWNLDKQREKKAANAAVSNHTQPDSSTPAKDKPSAKQTDLKPAASSTDRPEVKKAPVKKNSQETVPERRKAPPKKRPVPAAASSEGRPAPKKRPAPADPDAVKSVNAGETQRYSNIPPEKVRSKKEKAVRQNYEDMLAADPNRKPVKKKSPADRKDSNPNKRPAPSNGAPARKKPVSQASKKSPVKKEEPKPKFKVLRIILGIVSIIAFAFFAYKGFLAGLSNISAGSDSTAGITYIVLALCMLISGLLLLIMQAKRTVFAFILPMVFCIGGGIFAFLKRADDKWLLYSVGACALLAVILLVLTIASKPDPEDYLEEDPFE